MEKSNSTNSKMDHIGGVTIKVKNSSIKKKRKQKPYKNIQLKHNKHIILRLTDSKNHTLSK